MALPILEVPTYECELPSTGKKIKYRPFLVKEHKVILTLMDADVPEVARGITDLIDACTFNKLDITKLSHFDIEYLFLQLRSKSIGEKVELTVNCPCGAKIPHEINLDDIKVVKNENFTNKIMITDTIGVVMRYPKFEEVVKIFYDELDTESIMGVVCNCIEAVWQGSEYYDSFTKQEVEDFVNSLSKQQFDKLENFFKDMPKVVQEITKECPECGKVNEVRLEGLQNFFV
jgi:hypothetical protein